MNHLLQFFMLLLLVQITACGSETQEESAKESLRSAEDALENARQSIERAGDRIDGATEVLDKTKMYCCSNHEPPHCGTALEMEELITTKGCSGFEEQGITAE